MCTRLSSCCRLFALLFVLLATHADPAAAETNATTQAGPVPLARKALQQALYRVYVPAFACQQEPLTNVIATLQAKINAATRGGGGIVLVVEPDAVANGEPVTLQTKRTSVAETLKLIVNVAKVRYRVEDGAVKIVAKDNLGPIVRRAYDLIPGSQYEGKSSADMRSIVERLGVPFPADSETVADWNRKKGQLEIANTEDNHDLIERILPALNVLAPYAGLTLNVYEVRGATAQRILKTLPPRAEVAKHLRHNLTAQKVDDAMRQAVALLDRAQPLTRLLRVSKSYRSEVEAKETGSAVGKQVQITLMPAMSTRTNTLDLILTATVTARSSAATYQGLFRPLLPGDRAIALAPLLLDNEQVEDRWYVFEIAYSGRVDPSGRPLARAEAGGARPPTTSAAPATATNAASAAAVAPQPVTRLAEKLRTIVVPEVVFRAASVQDCATFLTDAARKSDPDKQGVDVIVDLSPSSAGEVADRTVTLSLRKIPLYDVLKYAADQLGLVMQADARGVLLRLPPTDQAVPRGVPLPKNPALVERLRTLVVPEADFRAANLPDCLAFFAETSRRLDPTGEGVNFVLEAPAQTPVTLKLSNTPLIEALKRTAEAAQLKLRADAHAVVFYASP